MSQKGEPQNGCFKKTCAYQGVRNVRFSEYLACFVFLKLQIPAEIPPNKCENDFTHFTFSKWK